MELKAAIPTRRPNAAFSLTSTLVGMGIGVMVLGAVIGLTFFSTNSLAQFVNDAVFASQNRKTLDRLTQEIRQADSVVALSTNALTIALGTNQIIHRFDPDQRSLLRETSDGIETLLEECDEFLIEGFRRVGNTNGGYELYPETGLTNLRVLQVSWRCSNSLLGQRTNIFDTQTTQVVLRN